MLNRNPSDEDGAALRRARDERGLRWLHRARGLRGLTPEQVRRIASRLDTSAASPRRRSLVPVLAALALVLSAGSALAWATGTLQRLPVVRALLTPRPAAPAVARPPQAMARPALPPAAVVAPIEPAIAGEREEVEAPAAPTSVDVPVPGGRKRSGLARSSSAAPDRRDRPAAAPWPTAGASPPGAPPPAPDSPIARESESFANVLRRWRRDHDGRAALAALDSHDRSFTGGQLALESRLLRVEVLLAARRDRDALALLDTLPIGKANVPRGRELLTVRGELRINAGRCDDGRADLASIVGGSDALAGRARNALTRCR